MPYFERKPYVNLLEDAVSDNAKPEQDPISDIARSVLDAETTRRHTLDGPFRCRDTLKPGSTGTIVLTIAAPSDGGPVEMQFEPGDLLNHEGSVLPADRVSVDPSQVRLDAGEATDVTVSLRVHDLAAPGRYQGRISGTGSERTEIVVIFNVAGR